MTFTRFFGFGLLLWLLIGALKAVFLGTSLPLQIVYLILVLAVTLGCCRRLGVLNILEGGMVSVVWGIGILLADWLIVYNLLGLKIFTQGVFWISYLLVMAAIFFGHKKRHIQIRKELASHHGGHH